MVCSDEVKLNKKKFEVVRSRGKYLRVQGNTQDNSGIISILSLLHFNECNSCLHVNLCLVLDYLVKRKGPRLMQMVSCPIPFYGALHYAGSEKPR